MNTLYVNVSLTLTKDGRWGDPRVQEDFNFQIPSQMFDEKRLGILIREKVDAMEKMLPEVIAEHMKAEAARKESEGENAN